MERLRLRITTPDGIADDFSAISGLSYGSAINGGFTSLSFTVPQNLNTFTGRRSLDYLNDVTLYDEGGTVVWNGYVSDLAYTIGYSPDTITATCVGYQEMLGQAPYVRSYINRDLAGWVQRPLANNVNNRPDLIHPDLGQLQLGTAINTQYGMGSIWNTAQALAVNQHCGWLYMPRFTDNTNNYIGTMIADYAITSNGNGVTPTIHLQVYGVDTAGSAVITNIDISTTGTSSNTFSAAVSANASNRCGILMLVLCSVAGTPATAITVQVTNVRIMGPRQTLVQGTPLTTETVYGHEMVMDIISQQSPNGYVLNDLTQIESDTSFVFDQAHWPELTPVRSVLDYITGFYDRSWAIFEDKRMQWKSTAASRGFDWLVPAKAGARLQLQPSIEQAASQVMFAYRDMLGAQRFATQIDANPNNLVTRAGRKRMQLVDLGVVSNGSPVTQIANIAFNQMRYEVMRGTMEIPAGALLQSASGQVIPAFKLRAGAILRVPDAARPRDVFSSSYDRRTLFLTRQVDVDWDSQTVRVSIDNNTDKLSQYLARIGEIQAGRFVGVL